MGFINVLNCTIFETYRLYSDEAHTLMEDTYGYKYNN